MNNLNINKGSRTALLAGATGLTGSYLLKLLINSPNYTEVKVIVRKPIELTHPKLQQIIFSYEQPDVEAIKADHIYCCLGTTIKKAGSKEAFWEVDYEYPLLVAISALRKRTEKFSIITAMGADKNSKFFYNKVKGELEEQLKKLDYKQLSIFRPSLLVGPRKEYRFGENVARVFMKIFGFMIPYKYKAIHVSKVAQSMYYETIDDNPGIHIIDSGKMQEID